MVKNDLPDPMSTTDSHSGQTNCYSYKNGECAPFIGIRQDKLYGRRLYIHEQSFAYLASQSIDAARLIYAALSSVPVIKQFHQKFVDDGVSFGMISLERAQPVLDAITKRWASSITDAFRVTGFRPSDSEKRHGFYSLISQDETIVATCFEINYYTFATTELAAIRMYEDDEDINLVKQHLREKNGLNDLTLIKGRSLALIDPAIGSGDNKAQYYLQQLKASNQVNETILGQIKKDIRETLFRELEAETADRLSFPSSSESQLLRDTINACFNSIDKGILKLSD